MAILKGKLVSGIELVLNVLEFDEKVRGADLVITGEGKFDAQSAYGKVPMGVAQRSRAFGVPVVVIAGTVLPSAEVLHQEGVSAYFSILNRPMTKEAMEGVGELLKTRRLKSSACLGSKTRSDFMQGPGLLVLLLAASPLSW